MGNTNILPFTQNPGPDTVDIIALLSSIRMFVWYFDIFVWTLFMIFFFLVCVPYDKYVFISIGIWVPNVNYKCVTNSLDLCDIFTRILHFVWRMLTYSSHVRGIRFVTDRVQHSFRFSLKKILLVWNVNKKNNEYFGGCGSF